MKTKTPTTDPTMRKVVYTVITGDYDTLKQPEVITPGWEYHAYVTDNTNLKLSFNSIWQVFEVSATENPQLQSRQLKAICPISPQKKQLLRTIYIDGNQTIIGNLDEFVSATNHQKGGFTTKAHPGRTCCYAEAEACKEMGKDTDENIKRTVDMLKQQKFPKDAGLSENGIMIRDYKDPSGSGQLSRAMKKWEKMSRLYSHRDQITLPFVLSKHPTAPHQRAPGSAFKDAFKTVKHAASEAALTAPRISRDALPNVMISPLVIPKNEESESKEIATFQNAENSTDLVIDKVDLTVTEDSDEKVISKPTEPANASSTPKRPTLNIYACVNESQLGFIPQFLENALGSNPNALVEVVIPINAIAPDVSKIEALYPNRVLIRKHEWLQTEANAHWASYRFLIEPKQVADYIFTPDIELMITVDVLETLLPLTERYGLPYFNTVRSNGVHMPVEHFSLYAALYGHALTPHLPEVRSANPETLLLQIVEALGNALPTDTEPQVMGKRMETV
jgi:hypothetical protein